MLICTVEYIDSRPALYNLWAFKWSALVYDYSCLVTNQIFSLFSYIISFLLLTTWLVPIIAVLPLFFVFGMKYTSRSLSNTCVVKVLRTTAVGFAPIFVDLTICTILMLKMDPASLFFLQHHMLVSCSKSCPSFSVTFIGIPVIVMGVCYSLIFYQVTR